jgi:Flp pilus assembly protein TadD
MPDNVNGYFYRANVEHDIKNNNAAIKDYNKAIALNEKDGNMYLLRGYAKHDAGDKNGACADFAKAKELGAKLADDAISSHCH